MVIACARRISDGVLSWPQISPSAPDETIIRQNAALSLGGVVGDWAYQELTQPQYAMVSGAMPARSKLIDNVVSSATLPSISSDKASIENDGVDTAIITFDVHDAAYTGNVTWKVAAPDGDQTVVNEAMVAGVATLELVTNQIGVHRIAAETIPHGVGLVEVTGV